MGRLRIGIDGANLIESVVFQSWRVGAVEAVGGEGQEGCTGSEKLGRGLSVRGSYSKRDEAYGWAGEEGE